MPPIGLQIGLQKLNPFTIATPKAPKLLSVNKKPPVPTVQGMVDTFDQKKEQVKDQQPQPKQSLSEFGRLIKSKYPQYGDMSDQELGAKMREKFPEYNDIVSDRTTFGEKVSNIGEGMTSFAGGLPKVISETGILDKPLGFLGRSIANPIRERLGKEPLQSDNTPKFSQVAKGSQVGGDPNSKLARNVETGMDIAATAAAIPSLIKGLSKASSKKGILNVVKEADTLPNKKAALERGGIKTQSSLSKWLSGTEDIVEPSKRTLDSVDEIVSSIKSPSKNPQKLFTQISDKISDLGKNLEGRLNQISFNKSNLTNTNFKSSLSDLATEIKDISPGMAKKVQILSKDISKATTADEFRKALQKLDDLVPDNVKKGQNLLGKDQYIYDAWRVARNEGNDILDTIGKYIPDTEVKKQFKAMSNLYHAKGQIKQNIGRLTPKVPGVLKKLKRVGGGAVAGGVGGYVVSKTLGKKGGSSYEE